jgi:hypothetical protein
MHHHLHHLLNQLFHHHLESGITVLHLHHPLSAILHLRLHHLHRLLRPLRQRRYINLGPYQRVVVQKQEARAMLPPVLSPPHTRKKHIIPVGNNIHIHLLLAPDPDHSDLEHIRRKPDRVGWPKSVLVQVWLTVRAPLLLLLPLPRPLLVAQVDEKVLCHLVLASLDEKAHYRLHLVYRLRPIHFRLCVPNQTWISIPRLRADPTPTSLSNDEFCFQKTHSFF